MIRAVLIEEGREPRVMDFATQADAAAYARLVHEPRFNRELLTLADERPVPAGEPWHVQEDVERRNGLIAKWLKGAVP